MSSCFRSVALRGWSAFRKTAGGIPYRDRGPAGECRDRVRFRLVTTATLDGASLATVENAKVSMVDRLASVNLFLAQVGDKAPREGPFRNSEGWPENSPVWTSTMDSYRVVWLFHRRLTPKYRQLVATASSYNRVHHLRSPRGCRTLSYRGAVHQSISGPGAQSGDQLAQPCSVGSNTVVGTIRNCRDGLTMSALKGIVLQKLKTERCRKSRKS